MNRHGPLAVQLKLEKAAKSGLYSSLKEIRQAVEKEIKIEISPDWVMETLKNYPINFKIQEDIKS